MHAKTFPLPPELLARLSKAKTLEVFLVELDHTLRGTPYRAQAAGEVLTPFGLLREAVLVEGEARLDLYAAPEARRGHNPAWRRGSFPARPGRCGIWCGTLAAFRAFLVSPLHRRGIREKKAALEVFSFNPLSALRFLGLYAV